MDTYASQGSTIKEPVDCEAAMKRFREKFRSSWVRMSVEGFNHNRREDEIESELINHFKSCGEIIRVDVPTDPVFESRAFVIFHEHCAKERALQLNGSDIGNWNALVKFAPEEEEEEYQVALHYQRSMYQKLASDKKFFYGVAVLRYDTSLPEAEVERALTAHFSSCGEITHVYVSRLNKLTNIYFSNEEGVANALDLDGSKVGGFKITTKTLATVRSNRHGPHDEPMVGYSIPAHFIEFADEINKKLEDHMTEWRAKARRQKVKARREQKVKARREQKFRARKKARQMARQTKEITTAMIRMETGEGQSFEKT